MNDFRDLALPLLFVVIVLAGTAAFVAAYLSLFAAAIFCIVGTIWVVFALLFVRAPAKTKSESRYDKYSKQIPSSFDAPEHGPIVRTRVPLAIEGSKAAAAPAAKPSVSSASSPHTEENTTYRQTLVQSVIEIQKLVNKTNGNLTRYQSVMGQRLGNTSGTEHRSLITARRVLTALDERITILKQLIANYDSGKDNPAEALALLNAPIVVPHDPLTTLPGERELPPIAPEALESTLEILCKQIARKPSFLQLLGVSRQTD